MKARLALAALATMTAVAAQFTTTPAQSVVPTGDCAEPYPVAEVAADDLVTGLTVSHGTSPEGFTGQVLGVVKGGIAPGVDMVMARLTSPEIDRVGGIWAGMSGSPVYADDGRLIGAVAYGLAGGTTPVAGVTPFEEMDNYAGLVRRVPVSDRVARIIAAHSDVTVAEAAQGFVALPLVTGVSGVSPARLTMGGRTYLDPEATTWGTAAAGVAGPESVVAGGNVALIKSFGDITLGAVGTVTSVCGARVIGFGHPVDFTGPTTAALSPAEAVYVQEDPIGVPFKVVNVAGPAGTFDQDRLAGATGTLGPLPPVVDITSLVTSDGNSRLGVSHAAVQTAVNLADTTWLQFVANHDRVLDRVGPGTADETWTITGIRPNGAPFSVTLGQQYASASDITGEAVWNTADSSYILSRMTGVKVTSVSMTSKVSDDPSVWTLTGVQRKVNGAWVTLEPGATVRTRAGSTLFLRALLTAGAAERTAGIPIELPASLAGTKGKFRVQGGDGMFEFWTFWETTTLPEFLGLARQVVRNDQFDIWIEAIRGGERIYGTDLLTRPLDKVVRTGPVDQSFLLVIR